ncbi:response regulator [Noviherbaspirillum sp.]|uniref:response regulator n=1 Tax=Noviherbaspirillum sp. TaxID=1926288 RepID=UPI002FE20A3B
MPRLQSDTQAAGYNAPNPPARVLIVEDNHHLAQLFSDLLEVLGCTSDVALSARSGLDMVHKKRPDLIFCDLRLPGEMDGFGFAREFRSMSLSPFVPLVAVTGLCTAEDREKAMQAGFDRIFIKPLKFNEIQELVDSLHR